MKLSITTTPDEMLNKGNLLISALASNLATYNPDLADQLYKSLITPDIELKYPVLADISHITQDIYRKHMEAMVMKIQEVINNAVKDSSTVEKSEGATMQPSENLTKFHDITSTIIHAENDMYDRIKQVMLSAGYAERDFDPKGCLYGKSVNELLDIFQADNIKEKLLEEK